MSPILAFVDLGVEPNHREYVTQALSKLSNVLEPYGVRGECDILPLVPALGIEDLWDFVNNIVLKTKGITAELTSIVLETDKCLMKKEKSV